MGAEITRRTFLVASAGATAMMPALQAAGSPSDGKKRPHPAKSTILFFLCGGASHIDTWDMKPDAPLEYRGEFSPAPTTVSGLNLCQHLPMTARQARHIAVVQGVTDSGRATGDHHAGYYYNLTGHAPDTTFRTQGNDRRPYADDWPFIGSVVGSRRKPHASLPQVISLPHKPSRAPYTRPGQFAARLGIEHDPFYVMGARGKPLDFTTPTLQLQKEVTAARLSERRSLLASLNGARQKVEDRSVLKLTRQQKKAFDLIASAKTTSAFDISSEPLATRERYGQTINGMSLLMARRLVEAGVPFITVFWRSDDSLAKKCRSAGSWDTHGSNFSCLKDNLLPEFDRGYSALLEDLAQRNLIDETLVMVTSEMGRKPKIGDPRSGGVAGAGRDHWTACMSVLMAGGGIQGGQVFGASDARAEYPADKPVTPSDIAHTVYHAMGVGDLKAIDESGQPFNLLDEGKALKALF